MPSFSSIAARLPFRNGHEQGDPGCVDARCGNRAHDQKRLVGVVEPEAPLQAASRLDREPIGDHRPGVERGHNGSVTAPDMNGIPRSAQRERRAASAAGESPQSGHGGLSRIEAQIGKILRRLGKVLADPERRACAHRRAREVEGDFVQRQGRRRLAHGWDPDVSPVGLVGNTHSVSRRSAISCGSGAP